MIQIDPYSPWSNAAEGTIRETKKGSSRKMIRTGSPKKLWDHCLELEAMISSNNAIGIYILEGKVPETAIKVQSYDIIHICELSWYQCVMFQDGPVQYPADNLMLGRYFGPA